MPLIQRKRRYQRKRKVEWEIDPDTAREVIAVVLILFGAIFLLSLFGLAGAFGKFIMEFLRLLFGYISYFFTIFMVILGVILLAPQKFQTKASSILGLFLFFIFFPALIHLFYEPSEALEVAREGRAGGIVGFSVAYLFNALAGFWVAFLILLFGVVVSLMITFSLKISSVFSAIKSGFGKLRQQGVPVKGTVPVVSMSDNKQDVKPLPGEYQLPSLDLLEDPSGSPQGGDINKNVAIISKTLRQFGITVTMSEATIGPTVTQYTLKPAEGVKLSQITARSNDLALALAAHAIRIEAPIPGKSLVGIEVPNQKRAIVTLKEIFLSPEWKGVKAKLPVALGRDVAAAPMAVALEKMPHLLVAGSTGSGKSIFLNALILSQLYSKKPDELKFILVDPKRVEFSSYNGIPHLLTPVVTDLDKTVSTLKWVTAEMERRYKLMQEAKKRDIESYNTSPSAQQEKLPYIIVIIDELADLMVLSASEVEAAIVRISQMARATGIHLVVATQRPSVDVITGLIKANITSRIAFAVASQVDSRTILDMAGAEKLIGAGDMLYQSSDIAKARRVQAPMIREQEVHKVIDFIKAQVPEVTYQEEVTEYQPPSKSVGDIPKDEMYDQAAEVVTQSGKASASLLQRRMRIGYTRAARLLDLLEKNGVIGPADGSKPREIIGKANSKREEG